MSFRRRRGLGAEPDERGGGLRVRALLGGGSGSGRYRRWGLAAALLLASVGAGYLIAAELLFPASSPAEDEALVEVPAARGTPVEEARERVEAAGLHLRAAARIPASGASEGRVLAQRPLGGQRTAAGDTVSVTVAAPEARLRVPALRSMRAEQARRVLRRMGFPVDSASEAAPVPGGEVVRTEPRAGELASPGSRVRVVVSAGPPLSRVPDLVGRHVDDVRSALADSGLALAGVSYDTAAFAAPGRVVAQSPPAGFSLREGERVTVRVAGRPASRTGGGADADSVGGGEDR